MSQVIGLFLGRFRFDAPAMTTIRLWILRVGLYLHQQPVPKASDWIFLIDHTCELGPGKVLVILGVRQSQLQPGTYNVGHQDVELLHLQPMDSSTGERMHDILCSVSDRVGVPRQIVSDHGSDLVKAERLFTTDHPDVIVTWDITHRMARLILAEIADDARWQTFRQACSETRNAVQQTALRFLAPPSQKGSSRCEHFDRLVLWGCDLLAFAERKDFGQITSNHQWDESARSRLTDILSITVLKSLESLDEHVFADRKAFEQAVQETLDAESFATYGAKIIEASDCGRRQFLERFDWVQEYQEDLQRCYHPMVHLVHEAERLVKHEGIHGETAQRLQQKVRRELVQEGRVAQFESKIMAYLNEEGRGRPANESLLGTSDVLESLFGKYKMYSSKSSFKELGASLLMLPVITTRLTSQILKNALEAVPVSAVQQWVQDNIGLTAFAQRIKAFRPPNWKQIRDEKLVVSTPDF